MSLADSSMRPPSPQSPPASLLPPIIMTAATSTSKHFEQTTRNLLRLGSVPMEKLAQDPDTEIDPFDVPLPDLASMRPSSYPAAADDGAAADIPHVPLAEAVRFLRDAAQREFGVNASGDSLQYEHFTDESNRCSCILTVTRPGGVSRAYRTKAEFTSRGEAKAAAASLAIQLGALHFMRHGDASGKRGLVLARLDAEPSRDDANAKKEKDALKEKEREDEQNEGTVAEIETCCIEWRAGAVVPKWVHLHDVRIPGAHGCALKVSLSSNIQRAYSVLPAEKYRTRSAAKAACARVALDQDVLEFIRHGDGLEQAIVVPTVGLEALPPPLPPTVTTLQAFHDALPQPLPDQVGIKANGEVNAVGWLSSTIQMAKGSRLSTSFTWYTDAKLGLHGCLLRLSRPDGPTQSYIADAIFAKRADAKLAACLLACSQGVGKYIRDIMEEIDSRMTPEMRRRATAEILPALGQALNRFRHGSRPDFAYESDSGTFGCTLTVDLSPEGEKGTVQKLWTVPMAYKSKTDAKFAVVCLAADNGALEYIKNRGEVPAGEGGEFEEGEAQDGATGTGKKRKRKKGTAGEDGGEDEVALLKKVRSSRRTEKETEKPEREPVFETREEAIAKGRFGPGPRGRGVGGRGRGGFGRVGRGGFGGNRRGMGFGQGFGARPGVRPPLPIGPMPVPHHPPPPPTYPHGYSQHAPPGYDHNYPYPPPDAGPRHVHGPGPRTPFHAPPPLHPPPPPPPPRYAHRADPYDHPPPPTAPYAYHYPPPPPPPPPPRPRPFRPVAYNRTYAAREQYPEHYAPDYDRIPDRPRHASPPTRRRASYSRPPAPHVVYERTEPVGPPQVRIKERLDNVISRFEGEAGSRDAEEHTMREQLPPKRGRSPEHLEELANKRRHVQSTLASGVMKSVEHSNSLQPKESLTPENLGDSPSPAPDQSTKRIAEGSLPKEKERRKRSEQREKSYVASLFEHCEKYGMPPPELCNEKIATGYKVWIIMGKERLELPMTFQTPETGSERVAKSVLGRVRIQTKEKET